MNDLEQELRFYRQQYDELGKQFLRLQEQQTLARREAKQSRILAMLIREAHRIDYANVSRDEIGQEFLKVVLGTLNVDRAIIMNYCPEQRYFSARYSLGFPHKTFSRFAITDMPEEYSFVNSRSDHHPQVDWFRQIAGVPYLLWTFNTEAGIALLIGNATEDRHLHRPFENSDREIIEVALDVFIDILDRKQSNDELRQAKEAAEAANRSKSEFLANMSHELRTPLNHIIGFTELVLTRDFGELNDIQEEYLNDVLGSSRHLLALINDILDLSKVEAGKLELNMNEFDLRRVLENSLLMIQEKALKHRLSASTEIRDIPETIMADERKFKQILYNLLSNAVKFTPEGGTLKILAHRVTRRELHGQDVLPDALPASLATTEDFLEISISDSGIGIEPHEYGRIFAPFEQIEGSKNRHYQGTGLGLALTKRFVEMHGGRIWVESQGAGKGSTFRFIIPNRKSIH